MTGGRKKIKNNWWKIQRKCNSFCFYPEIGHIPLGAKTIYNIGESAESLHIQTNNINNCFRGKMIVWKCCPKFSMHKFCGNGSKGFSGGYISIMISKGSLTWLEQFHIILRIKLRWKQEFPNDFTIYYLNTFGQSNESNRVNKFTWETLRFNASTLNRTKKTSKNDVVLCPCDPIARFNRIYQFN